MQDELVDIVKGLKIKESVIVDGLPEVRSWKVLGQNKHHDLGTDIFRNGCTRLVFPIDLENYYVNN